MAQQTAFALAAAHDAGIFHRDIKPENIMVRRDGIIKVLDFGLAKLTEESVAAMTAVQADMSTLVQTSPGTVMGTLEYMSPEQARGQETDERTDVWSLGCVIYEMVTGRGVFARKSGADTLPNPLFRSGKTNGTSQAVRSYLTSAKIPIPEELTAVLHFGGN